MKLCTQLNFGGNCEAAFRFYEEHLGGKITIMTKKDQLPTMFKTEDGSANDVVHARMSIAGIELIANDVPKSRYKSIRSSYLYLALDSPEEAQRVWAVLSEGGQIGMAIGETFFASRFGQLRDRFGTLWTIIHQRQDEHRRT